MFCPICGNEMPDSSKFCPKCGSNMQKKETEVNIDAENDGIDIETPSPTEEPVPAYESSIPEAPKKRRLTTGQTVAATLGCVILVLGIVFGVILIIDGAKEKAQEKKVITSAEEIKLGSGSVKVSGTKNSEKKNETNTDKNTENNTEKDTEKNNGFKAETPVSIAYEGMSNLFSDTSAFEFNVEVFTSKNFNGVSGQVVFGKTADSSMFHLNLDGSEALELLIWDNALYKKSVLGGIPNYMRVDFVYDDVLKSSGTDGEQVYAGVEKCQSTIYSIVYGLFDGIISTVMKGAFDYILPNFASIVSSLDNYFYGVVDSRGTGNAVYGNLAVSEESGLKTYKFDFALADFAGETVKYAGGNGIVSNILGVFVAPVLEGTVLPDSDVTVSLTVGDSRLRVLEVSCKGQPIVKLTLNYEFTLDTDVLEALVDNCRAAYPVLSSTTSEIN